MSFQSMREPEKFTKYETHDPRPAICPECGEESGCEHEAALKLANTNEV
jgi:hypothetical protein